MQCSRRIAPEISFASYALCNEIGEGIGIVMGSPSGPARDGIVNSIVCMAGDEMDMGEAISDDGVGILTGP
jgi:hypothetical protein